MLESLNTLRNQFKNDETAAHVIAREAEIAIAWVAETEPSESTVSPRTLGAVAPLNKDMEQVISLTISLMI
jgi:hypothetical protein